MPRSLSLALVIPSRLMTSDRRQALLSLVAGLILGIAASVLCSALPPPGSMLARTFNPSVHALIPYAIFCMFFWGVAICFVRWRRFSALAQVSDETLLYRAIDVLHGDDGLSSLRATLDDEHCQYSPLLRRLRAVLEQWTLSPGLQEAEVVLANQVALDTEASQRGYALVRLMVWALPVLGLIGTVLGIAQAVGGFANFLGRDINEVKQIRDQLVAVTGGLSFAFLITLQGLLTSLIAMLLVSMLQSSEERLFARIQRSIAEQFLPVLQRVAPAPATTSEGGPDWSEALREAVQAALKAISRAADQAVHQVATAGDGCLAAIRSTADRSAEAIQVVAENAGSSIAATAHEAAQYMARVAESSNTAVSEAAQHCLATIGDAAKSAVGEIRTQREAHARDIETLLKKAAEFLTSMADGLNSSVAAQTTASRQVRETANQVAESVARTSAIQASLADMLKRTEALKVNGTLDGLRTAIDGLNPILARFQQPFVLQAVPLPRG